MIRFALVRISQVIPTFIGITLLAFFLIRLVPGDPIETMAGERGIDAERHEALRKEFGFDQPVVMYLGLAVEQGPKQRIFSQPLHPYTRALLASTPGISGTRQRIILKGELPS